MSSKDLIDKVKDFFSLSKRKQKEKEDKLKRYAKEFDIKIKHKKTQIDGCNNKSKCKKLHKELDILISLKEKVIKK